MDDQNNETPKSLADVEKEHVLKILQTAPNLTVAAKWLNINRGTLYDLIERMGLFRIWVAGKPGSQSPTQGA